MPQRPTLCWATREVKDLKYLMGKYPPRRPTTPLTVSRTGYCRGRLL